MGKTDSINNRRVDVYLDSVEQKEQWSELADEANMSLSKFVQACVEYVSSQGGPDFLAVGNSAGELQDLEQELREKKRTIEEKDVMIEKLRTEVKQYRSQSFLEEDFDGRRQFDRELIDILKSSENVRSEEILRQLNVDTQNVDLIQAIQAQLDQLEQYGLVEETIHGWKWIK